MCEREHAGEAEIRPDRKPASVSILVIDEAVHQEPFLNELLPLWFLVLQVPVVVVGDDDAVRITGQLDNETVIITNNTSALNTTRWGEDQDLLFFQLPQDLLIYKQRCHPIIPPTTLIHVRNGLLANVKQNK